MADFQAGLTPQTKHRPRYHNNTHSIAFPNVTERNTVSFVCCTLLDMTVQTFSALMTDNEHDSVLRFGLHQYVLDVTRVHRTTKSI